MDLISGFPKNLAYTLKKLENFTKQTVKVMPDRVKVNLGEVSRFKLPASAMIDFRTIAIYADVSLYNNVGNAGTTNVNDIAYKKYTNNITKTLFRVGIFFIKVKIIFYLI